jgi:hypothetical protein
MRQRLLMVEHRAEIADVKNAAANFAFGESDFVECGNVDRLG